MAHHSMWACLSVCQSSSCSLFTPRTGLPGSAGFFPILLSLNPTNDESTSRVGPSWVLQKRLIWYLTRIYRRGITFRWAPNVGLPGSCLPCLSSGRSSWSSPPTWRGDAGGPRCLPPVRRGPRSGANQANQASDANGAKAPLAVPVTASCSWASAGCVVCPLLVSWYLESLTFTHLNVYANDACSTQ